MRQPGVISSPQSDITIRYKPAVSGRLSTVDSMRRMAEMRALPTYSPGPEPAITGWTLLSVPGKPTRLQAMVWGVLVLLAIIISLSNYETYQVGIHFDDAQYVLLAESLLQSHHFGLIYAPGEPVVSRFPFGYPMLLAPLLAVFPGNLDVLKGLSLAATVANAALMFWGWPWFSRKRSHWWALAIVGPYLLSPLTIDHTRRIMSEPVFTTFCLVALAVTEQIAKGSYAYRGRVVLSVALTCALFTRTIGITLIASVFMYLLLRRGRAAWKDIGLCLALMTLLVALIMVATPIRLKDILPSGYFKDENAQFLITPLAYIFHNGPGSQPASNAEPGSVEDSNTSFQTRLADYFLIWGFEQHIGKDLRLVAVPIGGGEAEQAIANRIGVRALPDFLGYAVAALVILGFARSAREEHVRVFHVFAVVYFASLFFWVWDDRRLLYPIQPQIFLGLVLGLEALASVPAAISQRLNRPFPFGQQVVMMSVVIPLILLSAYKSLTIEDSRLHAGDLAARTQWLKANSALSDIIMTEAPDVDYLYGGRKTVAYPAELTSLEHLTEYLTASQVRFILLAPHIDWQNTYLPKYDASTTQLLALLSSPDAGPQIRPVFASDRDLIRVFEVTR
jgi:hypothetical protein